MKTKSLDRINLADDIIKNLVGKCTLNEAVAALCHAIAIIMLTAEQTDTRNSSDGVAKKCGEVIQDTYDTLKMLNNLEWHKERLNKKNKNYDA